MSVAVVGWVSDDGAALIKSYFWGDTHAHSADGDGAPSGRRQHPTASKVALTGGGGGTETLVNRVCRP